MALEPHLDGLGPVAEVAELRRERRVDVLAGVGGGRILRRLADGEVDQRDAGGVEDLVGLVGWSGERKREPDDHAEEEGSRLRTIAEGAWAATAQPSCAPECGSRAASTRSRPRGSVAA